MGIPLLSFFTGGGLLDLGFEQAGFGIAWTNEFNPVFADMYEHAMTAWRRSVDPTASNARATNRKDVTHLRATRILREAFGKNRPELFGIIGGPPCPDFSIGGRNGGRSGKHGRLTRVFVDRVCQIRPHFFVMENVPGLFRTKKHRQFLDSVIAELKEGEYAVDRAILNGLELGIPQDRERLFVIGFRKDVADGADLDARTFGWFPWPKATYKNPKALPWPRIAESGSDPVRPEGIPEELTVYPLLVSDPEDFPNGKDCFAAHSSKFQTRGEGDVYNKSFKRLHRHRYSPTLWFGNNEVHLHPWKPRRLSVREALRIQTVPDEYVLPDDAPLSAKFKLICNGVPCRMAEQLARAILGYLGTLGVVISDA